MIASSAQELEAALARDGLRLVGQLTDASNAVFFGLVGDLPVVHKPVRGERPLWDYPTGDLASRERAAFLVDAAGGFGVVPPTVLVDGPLGRGSVQAWVTDPADLFADPDGDRESAVRTAAEVDPDETTETGRDTDDMPPWFVVAEPDAVPDAMLPVFAGELPDGTEVVVAHADVPELRTVAILDAVIDNSDRKGSHLLRGVDGRLWGIDHGVSLGVAPKLRTVLWGWAGDPIPEADLARVAAVDEELRGPLARELGPLLTGAEIEALAARIERLLTTGTHPLPGQDWPAVPWPPL